MTPRQADLLVLLAALIWGVAFYFQKQATAYVGPFMFTGIRSIMAAAVLAPLAWREHRQAVTPFSSLFPVALLGGVAFLVGGVLQQQGLITATVTNTSFLTALYVILTPFLLWLLGNESPAFRVWLSAGLAFCGIWALGGGTISGFSQGDWIVAASAVSWSFLMVATSASRKAQRPLGYTCLMFCTIAVLALPIGLAIEPFSFENLWDGALPMLYVGVLSSALTFALLAVAVTHMQGSRAPILLSTETLFAAAAGYLLLDERLGLVGWLGAALVFAAIMLIHTGRQKTA